jgi:hypothetical protein
MSFGKASVWLGLAVIAVAGLANCGDDDGDGAGGSSGSAGSSSGESGSSDKGGSDGAAGSPGETNGGSGHAAGMPGTGDGGSAGDGSSGMAASAGAVGTDGGANGGGGADGGGGAPGAGVCGLPAPVGSCDDRQAVDPTCVEYYSIAAATAQFVCESVETRTWTTGVPCAATELAGVCTFGAGDPPYQSNYYYAEVAGRQKSCEDGGGTWCAP